MKTLVQFINEDKTISKKDFDAAVAEYNSICDYWHTPVRMSDKITSYDSKRKQKMKNIIKTYLTQEKMDQNEFWNSNKWGCFS